MRTIAAWFLAGVFAAQAAPVPLFTDLGTHHHAITTTSPRAQRYFDQGLRLVYAFNHDEAIREPAGRRRVQAPREISRVTSTVVTRRP